MSETLLAFDVGARRIGVAVGNDLLRHAEPVRVIDVTARDDGLGAIAGLIAEWRPQRLVVGVPMRDGDAMARPASPASMQRCRAFARRLAERFALPVAEVDERYSSIDADAMHRSRRQNGARRAKALDDLAAQVILQRYLDALPVSGAAAVS